MNLKLIIQDAWLTTRKNSSLIWALAFPEALLGSLIGSLYLFYQFYSFYTSPDFFGKSLGNFKLTEFGLDLWASFQALPSSLSVLLLVFAAIFTLFYFLFPVFAQSALIQSADKQRKGESVNLVHAISFGFRRFLQLFEYQLSAKGVSFLSLLTWSGFFLRNLGPSSFEFIGIFMLLALVIGTLFSLLFTFAEYFLVLRDQGLFESIISSSRLVFYHWDKTLMMLVFMLTIGVRILINILLLIGIPLLMILAFLLFADLSGFFAIFIAFILGLGLWIGSSYFMAVIHVFTTNVWTFTFLELEKV